METRPIENEKAPDAVGAAKGAESTKGLTSKEIPTTPAILPQALVDGPTLLSICWHPDCKPSLRWLRQHQTKLPHVIIGRRVWFNPTRVMSAMGAQSNG